MRFTKKVVEYVEQHPYIVVWIIIILLALIVTIIVALIIIFVIIYSLERENNIKKIKELEELEQTLPGQLEEKYNKVIELGLLKSDIPVSENAKIIENTTIKLSPTKYKKDIDDIYNIIINKSTSIYAKKTIFTYKLSKYKFMDEFQKYYEYNTHFNDIFIDVLYNTCVLYKDININPVTIVITILSIQDIIKTFNKKVLNFIGEYPIMQDIINELALRVLKLKISKGKMLNTIIKMIKSKDPGNYFIPILEKI